MSHNMDFIFKKMSRNNSGTLVILISDDNIKDYLDLYPSLARPLKASKWFKNGLGQMLHIVSPEDTEIDSVIMVGVGEPENLDHIKIQDLGGKICTKLNSLKLESASLMVEEFKGCDITEAEISQQLCIGIKLKNYHFDKYYVDKKNDKKEIYLENISIFSRDPDAAKKITFDELLVIDGTDLTRDLISTPPNHLYPRSFVEECKKLEALGIEVQVIDEAQMKTLGMGALLGVAQGSDNEPYIVVMKWSGADDDEKNKPLAFVGKGVTFDTGGINLKPSNSISDMKYDMAGAGVVTGLMKALASRKAKVNAIGAIGLVENMCSGTAQRPSDIVTSMSGQTIEVDNTDAEGRLVLGDVLWYTKTKYKPQIIIDIATLTGAIVVALGDGYAGIFSNDDDLSNKISASGLKSGEKIWRMPLDDYYDKQIDSEIADIKNIGNGRGAGSTTAAQFLHRFVKDCSWAHIDIAGVAFSKKPLRDALPKGATGFGVRLLNQMVKDYYEN